MDSTLVRPITSAPAQNKVICFLEWVLTLCLGVVAAASFCGVLNIQPLHSAMSSVSYPRHRPLDETDGPATAAGDNYAYNLTLNLEISLLILAQGCLSLLLFFAIEKNSKEMYKMWVVIHMVLTMVICLPLFYQYALMTSMERSNILVKGSIQVMITIVWIAYRILSLVIILIHSCQLKPVVKSYVQL